MVAGTAAGSLIHLTKSKIHAIYQIRCINIAQAGDAEAIPGYHRGRQACWADLSCWVKEGFTSPHHCPWRMLSQQEKVPCVEQPKKPLCSCLPLPTHQL